MVDVFSEVNEELRREKLTSLWKKFGPYFIGAAVIFIGGIGFNVWWKDHVRAGRVAESERYQEALFLAGGGSEDEALTAYSEIIASSEYGYGLLARLQRASLLATRGRVPEAVSEYDAIASDSSLAPRFRDFASLMAAMILMDNDGGEEVAQRLEVLAQAGQPWYYSANEQLGLWKFRNQEYDQARAIFQVLMLDFEAPSDLRGRAAEILEMVENASPQNLLGDAIPAENEGDMLPKESPETDNQ